MVRARGKPGKKAPHSQGRAARKAVDKADPKQSADNKSFRTVLILTAILLLGLILRISYLREITDNPDFAYPRVDAAYHDYWARGLATGDWIVTEDSGNSNDPEIRYIPYFRPPGYPFFLAVVYYLSNCSYLAARIVQMALGLLSCVLAYFLGRTVFGRKTGFIFAGVMSTYWGFIYFEGELLGTALLVPLGMAVVYALCLWYEKITFRRAFASGVLYGVFALVRPNILLFGPAVLIWCWWVRWRRKEGSHIGITWLGFLLGAVVIISPVTIRNYVVARDFVLISSNLGISLHTGNNESSTGCYSIFPSLEEITGMHDWTCFEYPQIVRGIEALHGRKMKHSEVSSYFSKKAIDYIRTHKQRILKLTAKKAVLFWGPAELPSNKQIYCEKLNSRTLRYMPGFPMALSLGIIGIIQLFLGRKGRERQKDSKVFVTEKQFEMSVLMIFFIISYFLSILPFFIVGRYRLPVIPFLLLFGAYGLYRISSLLLSGRYYSVACRLVILIGLYFAASIHIFPYEPGLAQWHLQRASCYRLAKKPELAIEECREAVRIGPGLEKGHRRLADMLLQRKDYAGAIKHYITAAQLKPGRYDVHYHLGLAFNSQGELDQAISHFREALKIKPDVPEVHYSLGTVLKSKGQIETAIDHYRQALKLKPDYTKARYNLATVLLVQRRFDEAIIHLRWILSHDPNQANAHNYLGVALKSKGEIDEAISHYHQALKLKPDYYQAYNNLANALLVQRKVDEAISYYRRALKIKPDYAEAQHNMNNVLRLRSKPE